MRVLQVIGAMDRGGAETMLMNLYRAMDRSQIQFDFLVHEQKACDYDQEIQDLGGQILRLPRFTGLNLFPYRRQCREIFAQHPEHAVVHGHIGSSAALYLSEARRFGRVTVAHSHAQKFPLDLAQLGFRALSYPTRFIADRFLACSVEAGRDRFGERVVSSDAFDVVKNAIDIRAYTSDRKTHEYMKEVLGYGEVPLVGHVGRFHSVKNHLFLLEVFAEVRRRSPRAKLILVGRGPDEEVIRAKVTEAGLRDSVIFFGLTDKVANVLKALDVFAFPSLSEGVPLAAIEAQAAGVPCVISTGVSRSAAVVDGRVQRLALDEGVLAWADAVMHALSEGVDGARGAAGVREAGFDSEDTSRWMASYYEMLAKNNLKNKTR